MKPEDVEQDDRLQKPVEPGKRLPQRTKPRGNQQKQLQSAKTTGVQESQQTEENEVQR